MNFRFLLGLILVALVGCNPDVTTTPTDVPGGIIPQTPANTFTEVPTEEDAGMLEDTPTPIPASGPITLRVWLPPQFSPDPETAAGILMNERLDAFAELHPGIRITVRIKQESGIGGMVSSLSATTGAVPEGLPDLVLLQRTEMERAVQGQLLSPFEETLDPDWYDFARALAEVDQKVYGLPIGADALVMLHRPEVILEPPRDWTTALNIGAPILFAGGSPGSLFTFALYEAAGGKLLDQNQRAFIDATTLTAVLNFFAEGNAVGVFPDDVRTLLDESLVYENFQASASDLAISWISDYLTTPEDSINAVGLPTVTSVPYTLVTGWMWSLSNTDSSRQSLAIELAQFLTEPDFLSGWTLAAGVLPPRASALANWPESTQSSIASRIVLSGHAPPPLPVLEKAGPILAQALDSVLTGVETPADAAASAAIRVNTP